ncbi:hypothetical protein C8Q74DRAFT_393679 [Fomes fomentarius]|nr:hypothetical protein C8Q74DRAFT_393679 [Fomes fomentarius]
MRQLAQSNSSGTTVTRRISTETIRVHCASTPHTAIQSTTSHGPGGSQEKDLKGAITSASTDSAQEISTQRLPPSSYPGVPSTSSQSFHEDYSSYARVPSETESEDSQLDNLPTSSARGIGRHYKWRNIFQVRLRGIKSRLHREPHL